MTSRPTYEELEQGVRNLEAEAKRLGQIEVELRQRTHDLRERVKELNCLYGISDLVEKPGIRLEEILLKTTEIIPPSWQYPDVTGARILFEDQEYRTKNFKDSDWKQTGIIKVYGNIVGVVEVVYIDERPNMDEGPFLKEERKLLDAIAERLGKILERNQVENALKESEARYRALVEKIPAVTYTASLDEASTTLYVSPQIETMLGISQEDFKADPDSWRKHLHPDDKTRVLKQLAESHETSRPFISEYRMLSKDRKEIWFHDEAFIIYDGDGEPQFLQGVMIDISARKRAERFIHTLSQQLIKAQENERLLLSRDLHDHLAQDLSTLKIGIDTIFDQSSDDMVIVKRKVADLSKILQGIIATVRDLAYDLRPPSLDELGLVRTIHQYCKEFSEKTGLELDFYSAGMSGVRFDFDTEINLYRITQEALSNIKKHADAKKVNVRMVESFPLIIVRIEDDGRGFDLKDQFAKTPQEKRMGLRSMEERAHLLGGELKIQTQAGKGTRIIIEVPQRKKNG